MMTAADVQHPDTKQRIMDHALKMFATLGYEGASVRQIAKEAGVNIAAINYHFENKENLYYRIIRESHHKVSTEIGEIAQSKDWDPDDLAVSIFDHLVANGPLLVNVFKLFLSSGSETFQRICEDPNFEGPPGAIQLGAALSRRYPDAKEDDIIFVVQSLFTQLIHSALMVASLGEAANIKVNRFKPTAKEMRSSLARSARALCRELE